MKRYLPTFVFFLLVVRGFAEGIPSSATAFKGNVTLFDYSSPWAGLHNPALMVQYGGYPNPWVFRTSSTTNAEWGLGRLYLFSSLLAMGVNTSFYQLLEAYLYYVAYSSDRETTTRLKQMLDPVVPWTGGAFSTEMLNHPTNNVEYIKTALNLVLSNTSAGFYARTAFSVLSLFLPFGRNGNTLAFQPILDIETYGSLTARESTFFLFRDPEVSLWLKGGMVISYGFGEYDIPLIGNVLLGASVGVYPFMTRIRFENFEDIYAYTEAINTNRDALFQYHHVRQGFGGALDGAMMKQIGESWQVAVKVENLLSPILWAYKTNDAAKTAYVFDWILPNLIVGVRYTYQIEKPLKFLVNEPSLYCEMEDLLYTKPLALLSKIRLGADVKLLMDMLQVGVGLNQGYPTIGGKVNLTLSWLRDLPEMPGIVNILLFPFITGNMTAHATYYGKELGHYPGHKDALGYVLGIEYYFEFGVNGPSRKTVKTPMTEKEKKSIIGRDSTLQTEVDVKR